MYRIALVENDMPKHELIKLYNILSIRLKNIKICGIFKAIEEVDEKNVKIDIIIV